MARMRTSGPVRPPRVLITVYGSRLQTLHRLLLSLLSSHFGPDAVGDENRGFVRDGDSADYVSFLEDSFAVLAENAPPIGAVSLRQRWSQQQACLLLLPSSLQNLFLKSFVILVVPLDESENKQNQQAERLLSLGGAQEI